MMQLPKSFIRRQKATWMDDGIEHSRLLCLNFQVAKRKCQYYDIPIKWGSVPFLLWHRLHHDGQVEIKFVWDTKQQKVRKCKQPISRAPLLSTRSIPEPQIRASANSPLLGPTEKSHPELVAL